VKNFRPGDLVTINQEYGGPWSWNRIRSGDIGLVMSGDDRGFYVFLVLFPSGPEKVSGHFLEPVGSDK
jgi:hypothetical protein